MKLVWDSGGAVDLGDDSVKKSITVESLGGQCLVQTEPLAWGDHPFAEPRGNVSGQFAATVKQTFADVDAASDHIFTEYSRIKQKGTLAYHRGTVVFSFANAILAGVEVASLMGVTVEMRYRWIVGAVSVA